MRSSLGAVAFATGMALSARQTENHCPPRVLKLQLRAATASATKNRPAMREGTKNLLTCSPNIPSATRPHTTRQPRRFSQPIYKSRPNARAARMASTGHVRPSAALWRPSRSRQKWSFSDHPLRVQYCLRREGSVHHTWPKPMLDKVTAISITVCRMDRLESRFDMANGHHLFSVQ